MRRPLLGTFRLATHVSPLAALAGKLPRIDRVTLNRQSSSAFDRALTMPEAACAIIASGPGKLSGRSDAWKVDLASRLE